MFICRMTTCRYNSVEGALRVQATIAPAACERRALDGVAASCEAMKREVVKRLRHRRETSVLQRGSRGRLYAFGALSDTTTLADSAPQALGEVFFAKGAVVRWRRERSGHTWSGAISRGRVHRLLRSVRCQCASEGAGLAGFIASAVTERLDHPAFFGVLNWNFMLCCSILWIGYVYRKTIYLNCSFANQITIKRVEYPNLVIRTCGNMNSIFR